LRIITTILIGVSLLIISFSFKKESLRDIYSRPSSTWPKPLVDSSVQWEEIGLLPDRTIAPKDKIELGKRLFFDTRLSSSGKISCASCHQPELSWTDGKPRSIGHDSAINKRNAPSIQFSWFYNRLFWDGRAKNLEDQVFAPINSESEMHSDMPDVMIKLNAVPEYKPLFKKVFGDEQIDPDRMAEAIAAFERSIEVNPSRFDLFLMGNKKAMSDLEIKGLHVFRTKAGCMNCHNGPVFSDNSFHDTQITDRNDEGLYKLTHKESDKYKFKTPSLRNVAFTGPWLHDGSFDHLGSVVAMYGKRIYKDGLLIPFSSKDEPALLAFLNAISAPPAKFEKPLTQAVSH